MTNTKMTNAEKFAMVIEFVKGNEVDFTQAEMVEFLEGRKAQAEKANAPRKASGKPTKAQIENAQIAEKVKAYLTANHEEGIQKLFDMKTVFIDLGIEQLGKAVAVAKILEADGFMETVGQIATPDGKKRKGYKLTENQ